MTQSVFSFFLIQSYSGQNSAPSETGAGKIQSGIFAEIFADAQNQVGKTANSLPLENNHLITGTTRSIADSPVTQLNTQDKSPNLFTRNNSEVQENSQESISQPEINHKVTPQRIIQQAYKFSLLSNNAENNPHINETTSTIPDSPVIPSLIQEEVSRFYLNLVDNSNNLQIFGISDFNTQSEMLDRLLPLLQKEGMKENEQYVLIPVSHEKLSSSQSSEELEVTPSIIINKSEIKRTFNSEASYKLSLNDNSLNSKSLNGSFLKDNLPQSYVPVRENGQEQENYIQGFLWIPKSGERNNPVPDILLEGVIAIPEERKSEFLRIVSAEKNDGEKLIVPTLTEQDIQLFRVASEKADIVSSDLNFKQTEYIMKQKLAETDSQELFVREDEKVIPQAGAVTPYFRGNQVSDRINETDTSVDESIKVSHTVQKSNPSITELNEFIVVNEDNANLPSFLLDAIREELSNSMVLLDVSNTTIINNKDKESFPQSPGNKVNLDISDPALFINNTDNKTSSQSPNKQVSSDFSVSSFFQVSESDKENLFEINNIKNIILNRNDWNGNYLNVERGNLFLESKSRAELPLYLVDTIQKELSGKQLFFDFSQIRQISEKKFEIPIGFISKENEQGQTENKPIFDTLQALPGSKVSLIATLVNDIDHSIPISSGHSLPDIAKQAESLSLRVSFKELPDIFYQVANRDGEIIVQGFTDIQPQKNPGVPSAFIEAEEPPSETLQGKPVPDQTVERQPSISRNEESPKNSEQFVKIIRFDGGNKLQLRSGEEFNISENINKEEITEAPAKTVSDKENILITRPEKFETSTVQERIEIANSSEKDNTEPIKNAIELSKSEDELFQRKEITGRDNFTNDGDAYTVNIIRLSVDETLSFEKIPMQVERENENISFTIPVTLAADESETPIIDPVSYQVGSDSPQPVSLSITLKEIPVQENISISFDRIFSESLRQNLNSFIDAAAQQDVHYDTPNSIIIPLRRAVDSGQFPYHMAGDVSENAVLRVDVTSIFSMFERPSQAVDNEIITLPVQIEGAGELTETSSHSEREVEGSLLVRKDYVMNWIKNNEEGDSRSARAEFQIPIIFSKNAERHQNSEPRLNPEESEYELKNAFSIPVERKIIRETALAEQESAQRSNANTGKVFHIPISFYPKRQAVEGKPDVEPGFQDLPNNDSVLRQVNQSEAQSFQSTFTEKENSNAVFFSVKDAASRHMTEGTAGEEAIPQVNLPKNVPNEQSVSQIVQSQGQVNQDDFQKNIPSIVKNARLMVKEGRSEMHLKLQPQELGKMNMRLVLEDSALVARIMVDTHEAKNIFNENIVQLKETLQQNGINVRQLDVFVRDEMSQSEKFSFFSNEMHSNRDNAKYENQFIWKPSEEKEQPLIPRLYGYNTIEVVI